MNMLNNCEREYSKCFNLIFSEKMQSSNDKSSPSPEENLTDVIESSSDDIDVQDILKHDRRQPFPHRTHHLLRLGFLLLVT